MNASRCPPANINASSRPWFRLQRQRTLEDQYGKNLASPGDGLRLQEFVQRDREVAKALAGRIVNCVGNGCACAVKPPGAHRTGRASDQFHESDIKPAQLLTSS